MTRHLPRKTLASCALAAALFTSIAAAPAGAGSAPTLYDGLDHPAAEVVVGSNLFVANAANGTLSVLDAMTGALRGIVPATTLKVPSPLALVSVATAAQTRASLSTLYVVGTGGTAARLVVHTKGAPKATRLASPSVRGCHSTDAVSAQRDGASIVVLCQDGVLDVLSASSGATTRTIGSAVTGASDALGLATSASTAWITTSSTASAPTTSQLAAEGVVVVSLAHGTRTASVTNATCSQCQFADPDGIAYDGANLWVSNGAADDSTEITANGLAFSQLANSNIYTPVAVTTWRGSVYIGSNSGAYMSMVTRYVINPFTYEWMMCNSNDKYHFMDPTALAFTNNTGPAATNYLWVANPTNTYDGSAPYANTPGLLDQMDASTGQLVATFPPVPDASGS